MFIASLVQFNMYDHLYLLSVVAMMTEKMYPEFGLTIDLMDVDESWKREEGRGCWRWQRRKKRRR